MSKNQRFERKYGSYDIRVALENGQVLFNLIDSVGAAGYSRVASLRHHTKGKNREIVLNDGIYLSAKTLVKIGRDASNLQVTPYANWATHVTNLILSGDQSKAKQAERQQAARKKSAAPVPAPKKIVKVNPAKPVAVVDKVTANGPTLVGLKEAAKTLNMTVGALSDWLVAQGYAGRYISNNALFWKKWFKEQLFGMRPTITDAKGTRESNVAKLTEKGLEFVKARLDSERETNVLSFAKKEATARDAAERERLEKELDDLIKKTFLPNLKYSNYSSFLGTKNLYELYQEDLIKRVKEVIAQVKLKENNGLQGSNV